MTKRKNAGTMPPKVRESRLLMKRPLATDRGSPTATAVDACGDVLAVDPGLNAPGIALARAGRIVAADRLRVDSDWADLPVLERCNRIASAAMRWGIVHNMEPRTLIVEWPQWYPGSPIDPSDLAGLCGIAGAVAGQLTLALAARNIAVRCLSPKPSEVWGSMPKSTTGDPWASPRGQALARRLDATEKLAVGRYHDALDAAGLALYAVGRWERIQVFPGAV